jgi:rhodanese-related sulfurtransferase
VSAFLGVPAGAQLPAGVRQKTTHDLMTAGGISMFLPTITCSDARMMLKHGAQLVDVRNPHEYQHGALPGSVNIPLTAIQRAVKQLDKKTPVLLYCNSGQRSGMAKRLLEAYGFQLVHNMGSYNRLYECELAG